MHVHVPVEIVYEVEDVPTLAHAEAAVYDHLVKLLGNSISIHPKIILRSYNIECPQEVV